MLIVFSLIFFWRTEVYLMDTSFLYKLLPKKRVTKIRLISLDTLKEAYTNIVPLVFIREHDKLIHRNQYSHYSKKHKKQPKTQ